MEDKNKNQEPQSIEPSVGCGSLLSSARKKQKKSVEEIADELNLSITQIKTIELDQSEGLPEPTYVRGYIRSYAKLLGLDAEEVLENYLHPNWQKSTSLDDLQRRIGNADEESKRFHSPAKIIIFIVLLSSFSFLWFSGLLKDLIGLEDKTPPQTVVEQVATPLVTSEATNVDTSTDTTSTDTENAPEGGLVVENDALTEAGQLADTDDTVLANNDLTLTFSQTCWVDIRDSSDNRLAYKSYAPGEELTITNKGKLHVFLGNAEGVNAIYQGESFDISSYREGVYAKFSLEKN